jgi:hypothetical protein
LFLSLAQQPTFGLCSPPPPRRFLDHIPLDTHTLDEGSARPRHLYLTTSKHSQQTNIHAPGVIRTHDPASARAQTHASDRAASEFISECLISKRKCRQTLQQINVNQQNHKNSANKTIETAAFPRLVDCCQFLQKVRK